MAVWFFGLMLFIFLSGFCYGSDNFNSSQSLSDGQTLVSRDGNFVLGFFSPGNSKNRYVGIWYKKIPVKTVVWVANRINPINGSSGVLLINGNGNLTLVSQNNSVVWSTNSTTASQNPIVQIMDSGNLVIKDGNSETLLWQSFDYPTDTILTGMKIGWDLRRGLNRHISAWKSPDDPSPGDYTASIELYNYPDFVAWKGTKKFIRAGPWNGLGFSGTPLVRSSPGLGYEFVWNKDEVYFRFNLPNDSATITRYVLNQTIYQGQGYFWSEATQTWVLSTYPPRDVCDDYGMCGAYGSCDSAELIPCQCLEGFKPKASQLNSINWTQGCVRNIALDCAKGDGFIKYGELKLPDTEHTWVDKSIGLKECREICLKNCSCMAYTNTNISGEGSGCAIWFGDLIDMKQFQSGGQDLFIRMSISEAESEEEDKGENKMKIAAIIIPTAVFIVVVVVLFVRYYICRRLSKYEGKMENLGVNERSNEGENEDLELELFDLDLLAKATDDFSFSKKLGEGGFGAVYKGTLEDGKDIAVKRLSVGSRQGSVEFKNEVAVIAKLQHRNLVKLLGCCIQREEKMLVYEFMPNKSLDFFIFGCKLLDWPKRYNIINGIARGLVYLHQDSRLRIIHRDLKTSNVLLDSEMNPKISDFGLARTFGGDQTEGSTNRVVGTYGYMAPEYAINGQFSVKSDVFSFGILVLEIISGKKNKGFYHPSYVNLIGHAWELWKQGKPLELMDSILQESCYPREVVRCIRIALLCIQEHPTDRPTMSSVVLMLGSDTALEEPREPGFIIDKKSPKTDSSSSKTITSSNDVSISILEGR